MEISMDDFLRLSGVKVIDIRDAFKYDIGHISNSANIPYDKLLGNYSGYLNKSDVYYIYCQKGITSKRCAKILNEFGYHVYSIAGGYDAYILNERG